ncbi:MAG: hypothetical protein WDO16_07555 [Bacteroidota bacterium]
MTSTVVYNGDLRTTCTHLRSSSSFETDAPTDNNGKGGTVLPYRPYGDQPGYLYDNGNGY